MSVSGRSIPKVSVIVRAHNAATTLPRLLDCLAAQTLDKLQIMVIDAASTDATLRVLSMAQERDVTLEAAHIEAAEYPHAYNLGIERARGTYLFFMDGSDTMARGTLERLYTLCEDHNLDLAMGSVGTSERSFSGQLSTRVLYDSNDQFHRDAWRFFALGLLPYPEGKLMRRSCVKQAGSLFSCDGGMSFMVSFLKEASGVAFDPLAIYNANTLCDPVGWGITDCMEDGSQDMLDELFASWGLSQDAQTQSMLQNRYLAGLITSIIHTCSPACELDGAQKRAHIEKAIMDDRTQKVAHGDRSLRSLIARMMLAAIRRKDVTMTMKEGELFSWLTRRYPNLKMDLV